MARLLQVSRQPDGSPEIFCSVQGEGIYAGRPAVFLRLGLCNLSCSWCDTRYTWDWKTYDRQQQIVDISTEDVEREVVRHGPRYLVLTGGEPLIQQAQVRLLLEGLKGKGFFIETETNGTLLPDSGLAGLIDHWSVSPKLSNSGNPQSSREMPECCRFFSGTPSCHFKFVIQSKSDFAEVETLMNKYSIPANRVILMPEAHDVAQLTDRGRWLVDICKAHGCLFSTRLQVLLWGNARGV
ncbi:MAG: 7-carboxy-7-deazaguanine synthase QueE [Chloroflexi bacterium]|nr:7-carboxy-7-deazaguanine synthase QueE [Chloroflexota bacterium]